MDDIKDAVSRAVSNLYSVTRNTKSLAWYFGKLDRALGPYQAKYGGVFSGPESGYPVMLHGTEAVVPLSNGGSARMGKTEINININESRTPRETSREVVRGIEQFLRGSKGRAIMQEGAKGR